MSISKRALGALAAGALLVPLFASPASATHIEERTLDNACPADEVSSDNYSDVPDDRVFARAINCITDYQIATGFVDGEYKPVLSVTRQQMAQFIYRLMSQAGYDFDVTTDPGYPDDPTADTEQRDAIWGLSNAEVVRGFVDGFFRPGDFISRQQMASFIANAQEALGVDFGPATEDYFDDDNGTTHESKINIIAEEGVTVGRGGDRNYDIGGFVNRGQMAQFLARKLDILVEQGFVDSIYDDEATPTPTSTNTSTSTAAGIADSAADAFKGAAGFLADLF